MRDDPQILSNRLKAYVGPIPAKELSAKIGCDLRTAENIRRGSWPIARHWLGLVVAFGDDVVEAVFHPERAAERLEREVHDLERQLAAKKRAAADAARLAAGVSPSRAAVQNRAAPVEARSFATGQREAGE